MIPLKCLAVYKGRPALVTGTGDKIAITAAGPGGTEALKVREKDIEVLHPGPLESAAFIKLAESGAGALCGGETSGETLPGAEALPADVRGADVRGAWELIESGGVPVSLRELAELAFGGFTPQSAWASWLLLADGLYFTGTVCALSARSAASVEAAEEKRRGKARESQDRDAFLGRIRSILRAGQGKGTENAETLDPGDGRFLQDVEALACGQTEKSRTMKDLGRAETPQEAHRLLLDTRYWERGHNPHPRRFGLSLVHAAAELSPAGNEGRKDLSGLSAFAIDSPWSADPDDALSLESSGDGGHILYVHVADPASSVQSGSPADTEARCRGATLYLPEGTWRMLSEEALSRFALGLSGTSPALTFKLTLAPGGALTDTEIFPSTVKVTRLSYEEADALVSAAETETEAGAETMSGSEAGRQSAAILRALFELGQTNFRRRLDAGAVHITFPEVHITVSGASGLTAPSVDIQPVTPCRSADMVRECMLLAGEGAAAWAARHQLPFPYITQETGDLPAKPLGGLAGSFQLRRCMRPRQVSAKPGCHWGLGLDGYTQVTSPLRRYTDLLAHQQIRAWLSREAGTALVPLNEEEVLFRLAAGDAAAQAVNHAERASRAHWTAVYLDARLAAFKAGKIPEPVWDAVILDKRGSNTGIFIPGLALETQLGGAAGNPNETVRVRLTSVKIPEAEAAFAPET